MDKGEDANVDTLLVGKQELSSDKRMKRVTKVSMHHLVLNWFPTPPGAWVRLLKPLNLTKVVELTPPDGTLAEACHEMDINWIGCMLNSDHCGFVQKMIDSFAMKRMLEKKTVPQDTLDGIQRCFPDLLEVQAEPKIEIDSETDGSSSEPEEAQPVCNSS